MSKSLYSAQIPTGRRYHPISHPFRDSDTMSQPRSPPPPYRENHVDKNSMQGSQTTTDCEAKITERLRLFLSFCLAVDYDVVDECPDLLPQKDWLYWLRFSKDITKLKHETHRLEFREYFGVAANPARPTGRLNRPRPTVLSGTSAFSQAERYVKTRRDMEIYIRQPALALGVPPGIYQSHLVMCPRLLLILVVRYRNSHDPELSVRHQSLVRTQAHVATISELLRNHLYDKIARRSRASVGHVDS